MAVKAGTAFVDFEGDFSELNKQVSGHFNKLSKQAGETGKKAGDALGGSMSKQASSHFTRLSQQAGDAGKKAGAALGGAMKLGIAGAGVAAGGLFMKGLNDAIDAEKANSKLAAQLGSTKATSKKMGKIAGKVYADAYGDSLGQVNDAIRGIVQNDIAKKTGKDVEGLTKKTLDLASAFDQDVGDATRGVGQLLRTGLVRDANQAFDIITKGFQRGGDKAGDLIDTLNEYSTQWRKLGINAQTATGLIVQGLKAGARDSDLVADALKEFSIRALDGSKTTSAGFKQLGLDADAMQKKIGGGGKGAAKGLDEVLDKLRKIQDPVKRSQAAVALFGTQAEDLGDALFALDPSHAVSALGKVDGAAKKLGDTLSDNTAAKFESLKRKTFQSFQGVAAKYVLPEFNKILTAVNDPKLTTGEKWDKIGSIISSAIERSDLDANLKAVGRKAADLIWEGFKDAPIWVKVGGGVWLASKLGLTQAALKPLMALLSGRGGGGGLGGLGGLASKAAPVPVFVTNMGGLPGGKGPGGGPIITPGGGARTGGGILGKLRGVGKFAGKAGLAAMAADLAINLIDSKGNPISAVQNSAHDLTFGLVPEFKGDTEKAAEGVSSLKLKLDADVQANLPPDFDSQMTSLQKQMNDRLLAIRSRTNAANAQMAGAAPDAVGPIVQRLQSVNAADVAKVAELGTKLGTTIATAYTTAIDTHHEFFGAGQLTKGFTAELQKLPAQARQGAYDTMINWANTLVQQGRLPRSALNTLVGNFKTTMNLLPTGISAPAKRGIDSLTAQFRRRDMITAAGTMISDLKRKYGEFPSLAKSSGENMASNFLKSITFLRDGAMHATGKLKTQTKADLKSTRDAALDYAGDMNSGLNAELISMGVKGDKNAKKVRDNIVTAFTQMASGTGTASASSASTLYTALSNMDVNADEILSALGITVPKVSLTRPPVARAGPPGTKGWNEMRPTQTGAYVSGGKPSGDSVPILAERGEYVLNREAVKKVGKGKLDQLNFGEAPRFQSGGFVQLVAKANQIDDQKFPYLWGGGHDAGFSGPYDCSGAISAILHAAGLLQMPMVSGDFMNFGQPGPGGEFTIFANPGHVYGRIGGRYWGTSNSNPGGGAGFFDGAARPGFTVRHVDLVDPTLPVENVSGMPGKLTDTSQAIIDNSRKSYQSFINSQIATLGSLGGGDDGDSLSVGGGGGPATGNGADLMKSISKSRGWNFADWWALDAKESSHGTNLTNPTSTARLRGQFLDSNWGSYGPGSDPRQNPSMSEQIRSMAAYIADRYVNPTRAWAAWQSHFPPGWYQSGGMISKALGFVIGGAASKSKNAKPKPPKVKNPKVDGSLHSKKHKPKDHITNAMIKSLGNAGATQLMEHMNSLEFESNKYADWAQRAGDITNTEALQTALNAQMALLGGTSDMSQAKLDALFPASQQDAFIEAWLRNPLNGAMFNSGTQSDWLSAELNQLLGWRNELIDNPPVFRGLRDAAKAAYDKIKADIKRIEQDIALIVKRRDAAIKKEEDNAAALRTARTDLASAKKDLERHPKSKTRQARVKRLTEHVAKYRAQRDSAHKDRVNYNKQLSLLRGNVKLREDEADTLGGDDGTGGRIGTLSALIEPNGGTLGASLNDVQGLGSTLERYVNPSQFQLGALGGTILGVQTDILRLTANPLRASAEEAATPTPDTGEEDTRTKDLLSELLRQANLRFSVSEAQYDVLRGLPFGGTFHSGGVVPGPLGAPRMILAQGGEVVLTNDAANATSNVSVNFANGMEWLKQFVDIRVEDQTRTQGRRGERQLPGRPGILR
jgi:phage-related minor tail protein